MLGAVESCYSLTGPLRGGLACLVLVTVGMLAGGAIDTLFHAA